MKGTDWLLIVRLNLFQIAPLIRSHVAVMLPLAKAGDLFVWAGGQAAAGGQPPGPNHVAGADARRAPAPDDDGSERNLSTACGDEQGSCRCQK
jgi:hypothetical protein